MDRFFGKDRQPEWITSTVVSERVNVLHGGVLHGSVETPECISDFSHTIARTQAGLPVSEAESTVAR